jgi:hypothetical protein
MEKTPNPRVGFTDNFPLVKAREKVFESFFGTPCTVNHELAPLVPHLDVYIFEPNREDRDFFTLATGGMSDLAMKVPSGVPFRRAELILYVEEPKDEYVNMLRWLAHLIHDQQTWMSPGSTMTNGQPPVPIFESSVLDCYFFLAPPLEPDNSLPEKFVLKEDPVTFLWVVPITHVECEFIRQRGLDDFLGVLDKRAHPFVLDPQRKSYI